MSELVLDASVLLKWFHSDGEADVEQATRLRSAFEAGQLKVLVPSLVWLELLNVAARRLGWPLEPLERLANQLQGFGFTVVEPELVRVARWAAAGMTAYDAAYVAVAEQSGAQLITADAKIVRLAPEVATVLA